MNYSIEKLPHSIKSKNVQLHLLQLEDAGAFYKVTNNPEITALVSFLSYPVDPDFPKQWIGKNDSDDERVYGIFAGVKLVGHIGAHLDAAGEVEIGYWVNPDHMGKGITSTAVRNFVLSIRDSYPEYKIFAECRPDNEASIRVLTKNGFVTSDKNGKRPNRIRLEYVFKV